MLLSLFSVFSVFNPFLTLFPPVYSPEMDLARLDYPTESRSQTHRSRTGSPVSSTEGLFQSLELVEARPETSDSTSYPGSRLQASDGTDASIYNIYAAPTAPAFSAISSPNRHLALPPTLDSVPDARWFRPPQQPETTASATAPTGAPFLRSQSAPRYAELRTPSTQSPSTSQRATMRYVSSGVDLSR